MKAFISITDETIKENCLDAVNVLEEEGAISFPSERAKTEFTDDLIGCVIQSAENYFYDDYHLINMADSDYYEQEAYDLAKLYGYIT